MRRDLPRPGERVPHGPGLDTDPIDLREVRRVAPPRAPEVYQPFADGRRPALPSSQSVTMTVLGAPIPDDGDPAPDRRHAYEQLVVVRATVSHGLRARWTPRRRRRFVRTASGVVVLVSVVLVVVAAVSVLAG